MAKLNSREPHLKTDTLRFFHCFYLNHQHSGRPGRQPGTGTTDSPSLVIIGCMTSQLRDGAAATTASTEDIF